MTLQLLVAAVLVVAVWLWRQYRVPIRHRWRRRQARTMCQQMRGADRQQPAALLYARLRAMDPLAFEELLLEAFAQRGYRVTRNRRYTGDGGVDGKVVIDGVRYLIQAKRYQNAIRPEHVSAFADLCAARRCKGLFIHTGRTGAMSRAAISAALVAASPAGAAARGSPAEEARIAGCVRQAARGADWLEKTLWSLRAQEAGWLGAEVANTNGTHDLGPLQINSAWVPRIARLVDRPPDKVRRWLRDDACFNAEAARWIFLSGLADTGDFWKAVGVYHSPTPWRQQAYAAKVAGHMRRLFGPRPFAAQRRE
jgi:hypothetical protein